MRIADPATRHKKFQMHRNLFAFMMLLHGMFHLPGFLKAFEFVKLSQFGSEIAPATGWLCLLATLMFLGAEILFVLKQQRWWMAAVPAVILSQYLVMLYWQEARLATLLNIVIFIVAIIAAATWHFQQKISGEITSMFNFLPAHVHRLHDKRLHELPLNVQHWLERSGATKHPGIQTVRLRQKGSLCTKPGGRWMDFDATQYFVTQQPAFNWQARIQLMPLIFMLGRDKYENGKGSMLINLMGLKKIVDPKPSPELNQGTMLRFLSELCWFPAAALNDYLQWENIDDHSARATMTYGGVTVSGVFFFNKHFDISGFEAMRYGEFDGNYSLEKWQIGVKEYKQFEGIRIPSHCEVTWKLAKGDFTWLKLEVTALNYNKHEAFPSL